MYDLFFSLTEEDCKKGVIIICRSPSMSKFKLILFDKEGGVRQIEESLKRKQYTTAEMYFVPFDHMQLSELFPLKFFADDKETPVQFHLLDTFENSANIKLEPREHIVCVYGDNWLQDVKYNVKLLVAECRPAVVSAIETVEKKLALKKQEMSTFQTEFVEARKRFQLAVEKLDADTKEIRELLKQREAAYGEFLDIASVKYQNQVVADGQATSPGLFKGLFSSVLGSK